MPLLLISISFFFLSTFLLFSNSRFVIHSFFIIILAWSHTCCSVISVSYCSFQVLCILLLYPLTGLPSSFAGLLKKCLCPCLSFLIVGVDTDIIFTWWFTWLDPLHWLEGSYKWGSFLLSFYPSSCSSLLVTLLFELKTLKLYIHVSGLYGDVCDKFHF